MNTKTMDLKQLEVEHNNNNNNNNNNNTIVNNSIYEELIEVDYYTEQIPLPTTQYFKHQAKENAKNNDEDEDAVSIFIAAYNEQGSELKRTLQSINKSSGLTPQHIVGNNILVVFDGVERMAQSMKNYVEEILNDAIDFQAIILDFEQQTEQNTLIITKKSILNNNNDYNSKHKNDNSNNESESTLSSEDDSSMNNSSCERDVVTITFLIKRQNKGKANSHEWYLKSFVQNHTYR
eukprot:Pgem_evm2s14